MGGVTGLGLVECRLDDLARVPFDRGGQPLRRRVRSAPHPALAAAPAGDFDHIVRPTRRRDGVVESPVGGPSPRVRGAARGFAARGEGEGAIPTPAGMAPSDTCRATKRTLIPAIAGMVPCGLLRGSSPHPAPYARKDSHHHTQSQPCGCQRPPACPRLVRHLRRVLAAGSGVSPESAGLVRWSGRARARLSRQISDERTVQPAQYGSPQVTSGGDGCSNGRASQRPAPPGGIKVWVYTTWGDAAAVPSLCSTQSTPVPARK